MTVSIPAAYDPTDISISGGVATGQLITSSAVQVLINNHNFVGGNFCPTVGNAFSIEGYTAPNTGTDYQNFFVCPVKEQVDGRGLQFVGYFTNSSSSDLVVRLACKNDTGSDVTIPASTTTPVQKTLTCDTPTSGNFVAAVQGKTGSENNALKCYSGSLYWLGKSGSQSSAPTTSGFVWGQTAQHASTYPFTVEHVNRLLGGPAKIWKATPQCTSSMLLDVIVRPFQTTSTSFVLVGYMPTIPRGWDLIDFLVVGSNGVVQIDGASITTGTNSAAATTAPGSLTSVASGNRDFSNLKDGIPYVHEVYFKSTDGNSAFLYSVVAFNGDK